MNKNLISSAKRVMQAPVERGTCEWGKTTLPVPLDNVTDVTATVQVCTAHALIGIAFAAILLAIWRMDRVRHPKLIPALILDYRG
jgi:hypothetical protein